ncbi:MAG: prolyl aminopeptidase [Gammaproteobacteria bacterium]|nr:prolyl aminopeptidase [Gammaproteobacteria bacterium]
MGPRRHRPSGAPHGAARGRNAGSAVTLRTLYPATEPRLAQWLPVGDGHEIYFEDAGAPEALPVVFLHGGPGGGCKPSHRQFFAPARYRAVLFDQRGAGRSRPFGETAHNTTPHLVADMERLREHLAIESWVLFAGSWGAALALAYAEQFPDRVRGIVLRGAFLARPCDLDWFLHAGAARLLPQAWAALNASLGQPAHLVSALHQALFGADPTLALAAARAWTAWSTEVVMYSFNSVEGEAEGTTEEMLAKARIELHYAVNRYFLADNQLLAQAHRLPRVPVHLVHGQRDLTCTAAASWALHQAIPGSRLEILRTAGHLSGEPLVSDALLRAADQMADELLGHV